MLMEKLNNIAPFIEMAELVDDPEFADALAYIVKIMQKPDIPPADVSRTIVRLQAYSAKFSMLASYYVNIAKGDRVKKNLYFSISKALDDLVGALKYVARSNYG